MAEDYRSTLFLPQTDFPMRGNLPQREPLLLERWNRIQLYQKSLKASDEGDPFILHDGPPYANGNIHVGTGINKILKDVILRSQFKLGKYTPYIPGWDCHGLPIEHKVEEKYRKKGADKDSVPLIEFRKECRDFAQFWLDTQRDEFKRLGVMGDWENNYSTMNYDSEAEIVRMLGEFLLNGGLYRGCKPVMWSVVEKTALAEAEVEYKDHESPSIYVRFPIVKSPVPALEGAGALIWTTTPWTLPSNRAIAYGDNLDYNVVKTPAGDTLLIAQALMEEVKTALELTDIEIIKTLKGPELAGTISHHPLHGQGYDYDVPFYPGEHVTTEAGTGLVHTAPSHGVEDFELGQTHGLDVPELVSDGGLFHDRVPLFAGQHIFKVNPKICAALEEVGHLLHESKVTHSYPHSWRSKKPLIYRATPQWFISMETGNLRDKTLAALDKVKWVPKQSINRIKSMVEGRPDWCVSRQRAWGVPITVFVDKKTGEPLRDPDVMSRIVEAVKAENTDVWYTADPQTFLGDKYKAEDYEQIRDILDVWFDSGCTHSFVLKDRDLPWPADLYLEGSDQHRGWFQSSALVGTGVYGTVPYKQVLTHGFVVDEQGRKMSKSQGNVMAPSSIAEKMGIDIMRLLAVGTDFTQDMRVGPQLLQKQQDIYRRYRNTFRYLLGALDGFDEAEMLPHNEMPDLEKWVLHRLHEIGQKVQKCNEDYAFQELYVEIHNFCAVDLSAFYFDIRKDSLYCDRKDNIAHRATRTAMNHIFECLVRWIAPVLCFTAEEAWLARHPSEDGSVHLERFPEISGHWQVHDLHQTMEKIRAVRSVITGALELKRADKTIGSSLQAHVDVYISPNYTHALEGVDLAELSITSTATLHEETAPQDAFTLEGVESVGVVVTLAKGTKCSRCWKVLEEVGQSSNHPDLCGRCEEAVEVANAA